MMTNNNAELRCAAWKFFIDNNAAAKITDDLDVLLAFYDYPAEHWMQLRTTKPTWSPPSPPSGCGSA